MGMQLPVSKGCIQYNIKKLGMKKLKKPRGHNLIWVEKDACVHDIKKWQMA